MEKRCSRCNEMKPRPAFYVDNQSKDGLQYRCKACATYYSLNRAKSPKASWASHIKGKYGVSVVGYLAMMHFQDYKCAICRQPNSRTRKFAIDHCHSTGRVRGLLCQQCNLGVGNFEDDLVRLSRAIDYVSCRA